MTSNMPRKKWKIAAGLLMLLVALTLISVGASYVGRSLSPGDTTISALAQGGHFHGIAVDVGDSSRIYFATHHGLYLAGSEGKVRQISQTRDDFMGFTPHPTDPSILFASGHPAGGGNLGFVVSKDKGRSWTKLANGIGGPVDFHQMDISKADPRVIFGVYEFLQRSSDGGRTWERAGAVPAGLMALAASSSDANTLYAATQSGLKRSTDGGRTWSLESDRPATMVHVTRGGTIYAFMIGLGLVRAAEKNLSWQVVGKSLGEELLLYFAADPHEPRRLYAVSYNSRTGMQSVIASQDGGEHWARLE